MKKRKSDSREKKKPDDHLLRTGLGKLKKIDLVNLVLEISRENLGVLVRLKSRFEPESGVEELVELTRHAIEVATDFEMGDCYRNFDFDYDAYQTVKRNLTRLVKMGQLTVAMDLSLELMKQGSYQAEMSAEALMTGDIEECLLPVLKGVEKSNIPSADLADWCEKMIESDRIGCILDKELKILKEKFVPQSVSGKKAKEKMKKLDRKNITIPKR